MNCFLVSVSARKNKKLVVFPFYLSVEGFIIVFPFAVRGSYCAKHTYRAAGDKSASFFAGSYTEI